MTTSEKANQGTMAPEQKANTDPKVTDQKPAVKKKPATKKKPAQIEHIITKSDPKARPVVLERKGEKYRVRKDRTAFTSDWLSKQLALKVFNVKIHCSQN